MSLSFVKPSVALIRVKTRTLKNQGCGTRAFAQRRVTSLSFVNPTVALIGVKTRTLKNQGCGTQHQAFR
jgi:hypothetical protein